MLEAATTKQFRDTVRAVCREQGIYLGQSWTNGAPTGHFQSTYKPDTGNRTVGFYCDAASAQLAAKIEQELNKQGVSAGTHYTDCTVGAYGGRYIRGTCVLA